MNHLVHQRTKLKMMPTLHKNNWLTRGGGGGGGQEAGGQIQVFMLAASQLMPFCFGSLPLVDTLQDLVNGI